DLPSDTPGEIMNWNIRMSRPARIGCVEDRMRVQIVEMIRDLVLTAPISDRTEKPQLIALDRPARRSAKVIDLGGFRLLGHVAILQFGVQVAALQCGTSSVYGDR